MQALSLNVPALFGDHHVIEIRRLLLALPGVKTVFASSGFQMVDVTFDPALTGADAITACLEEAGYLGDLALPQESDEPATMHLGQPQHFRHTAAYQQTGHVIGFAQTVSQPGRALWPCPGLGTIRTEGLNDE